MCQSNAGLYQVTANGEVVGEFGNGYDAGQWANKFFISRAARGKAVSIRRSDGAVPYTA
jgi:hypothetical protein